MPARMTSVMVIDRNMQVTNNLSHTSDRGGWYRVTCFMHPFEVFTVLSFFLSFFLSFTLFSFPVPYKGKQIIFFLSFFLSFFLLQSSLSLCRIKVANYNSFSHLFLFFLSFTLFSFSVSYKGKQIIFFLSFFLFFLSFFLSFTLFSFPVPYKGKQIIFFLSFFLSSFLSFFLSSFFLSFFCTLLFPVP